MTEKTATDTSSNSFDDSPPETAPENISLSLRGFGTEEHARAFGNLVASYIRALSRHIDLTKLDGVTISSDYAQSLLDLDRGYTTSFKLMPSEGIAFGVAMTPAVIRDGEIKSHMLFNAGVLLPLEDENNELYAQALHTLAHECAHVEVTARFDNAFPFVLLQSKHPNAHAHFRWEIIKACWDEYAVTQICAPFGRRPTDDYEETFITSLEITRLRANELIKAYRTHSNIEQITAEIYGVYGELLKFASYHLGNMIGLGLSVDDLPKTKSALDGHWFEPHFAELQRICGKIAENYGEWADKSAFEALGDLADKIVAEGGVIITEHNDDGGFFVDVPFTPQTMPG